ncbi:selenium metabolism-associated LysR family transcriptional regulator [Senegalia massiliensis]|uniref:LysR family transcriptional regulator n=1 Tax=Senegalia massiliensis TaxID=1720316 RepID=A0A845QVI1_9CLOT|nr:selenium metabolism-associated LysR family transcriptional regulator [Senegalia massiliensis]NBI05799.1 LysR family transcriptional regulator [Senegalia massiliensis]
MDFRQLETFVQVIDSKSFSKAATNLYLTQPTVTSHIQNLEKEVGTALLNRSNKNITYTKAGSILYDYAKEIINLKDTVHFKLGEYKGKIEGNLLVESSTIPKLYILPYLLKDFIEIYPNVTIDMKRNNSKDVIKDILNNNMNFGIVGAKLDNKNLEYIELIEDELVLISSKCLNSKKDQKLNLDDIKGEKLIMRKVGSGSRLLLETALKQVNQNINKFNVVATSESNEAIKKLVELNVGVSFISKLAIKEEIKRGILKSYTINNLNLNRKFYFVYHKKRNLSPLANTFKNFVLDWIKKTKNAD